MKIRTGFVSNSSSSSFCIYKKLMSDKQIEEFREILKKNCNGESYDDETCIGEDGDYFIGNLSMHNETIISYLRKNFKTKVWADYC
jgi:hypothetical protein